MSLAEQRAKRMQEREIESTLNFVITYCLYIILLMVGSDLDMYIYNKGKSWKYFYYQPNNFQLLVYNTVNSNDYRLTKVNKDAYVTGPGGFEGVNLY